VETHENITRMLDELRAGRREVESRLLEAVYPELRRIAVNYARRKKAQKREGKRQRVELTDTLAIAEDRLDEIIAVDAALDPRGVGSAPG
jgi:hypothetical protein